MVPARQRVWGPPGKQGGDANASPGKGWAACPSRLPASLGAWERVWGVRPRVMGLTGEHTHE